MKTQGTKEVKEAVLIAALVCFAQGLVTWGFEAAKAQIAKRKAADNNASESNKS